MKEMQSHDEHRGHMYRHKRQTDDTAAREFLAQQKFVHCATTGKDGYPYAVPLVFVYEKGDILWLHTGRHDGHFYNNLLHNPKICIEVSAIRDFQKGGPYACNSSQPYTSVILFGTVEIVEDDEERKNWFFDQLLVKHGKPEWEFKPGYPLNDRVRLYKVHIEKLTGKENQGLYH